MSMYLNIYNDQLLWCHQIAILDADTTSTEQHLAHDQYMYVVSASTIATWWNHTNWSL